MVLLDMRTGCMCALGKRRADQSACSIVSHIHIAEQLVDIHAFHIPSFEFPRFVLHHQINRTVQVPDFTLCMDILFLYCGLLIN